MSDVLSGVPIGQLTAPTLLVILALLVFIGKIPTLRELRDSQEREKRAMELAEKWQAVATEHGMTLHQILDGLEVVNHAMTEIQSALKLPLEKAP